jgi:hypothetical protein
VAFLSVQVGSQTFHNVMLIVLNAGNPKNRAGHSACVDTLRYREHHLGSTSFVETSFEDTYRFE